MLDAADQFADNVLRKFYEAGLALDGWSSGCDAILRGIIHEELRELFFAWETLEEEEKL